MQPIFNILVPKKLKLIDIYACMTVQVISWPILECKILATRNFSSIFLNEEIICFDSTVMSPQRLKWYKIIIAMVMKFVASLLKDAGFKDILI